MSETSEIVHLLDRVSTGDKSAEAELYPRIYADLRQLAAQYLRRERPDHTLQATALVHEVYLRLIGWQPANWRGRTHFFAASAQAMRRILIDHARQSRSAKRGGAAVHLQLDEGLAIGGVEFQMLDELDEALTRLATFAPRQAQVVEMRFFGGMTEEETAEKLGISSRTVKRDWNVAKAWLYGELCP